MTQNSALPVFNVVGFSGHRRVSDPEKAREVIQKELSSLSRLAHGEWVALSSIAEGADQLFVEASRSLGLSWHAILPLPKTRFAEDFTAESWQKVESMLDQAEFIQVISENGTREDAYLDCGMETVNSADLLFTLWDGDPARGKGGTADVVAYARELKKPIVIIDANSYEVRRENLQNIRCSDHELETLNALPASPTSAAENPFRAPDFVFAFQRKCDEFASRSAPKFRRLISLTVIFHVVATLVAAAALAFDWHALALPWLKLLCLVGALGVALALHRKLHSGTNWVKSRLAAEFCRSSLATWGLPRAAPLFQDLEMSGVRGLTRSLHILHSRSSTSPTDPVDKFKAFYIKNRIDDQLAYYRKQESRAIPLYRRLRQYFWASTVAAILSTAAYAVAHTLHAEVGENLTQVVFYFLPITLPVIAAAMISFISINDLQRRVARYQQMSRVLAESRSRMLFSDTWNSVERVVLRTERALLQEVLEWNSITSFTESH